MLMIRRKLKIVIQNYIFTLRWDMEEDYGNQPFGVIITADVVTSVYNPRTLTQTIYDLSHAKSIT